MLSTKKLKELEQEQKISLKNNKSFSTVIQRLAALDFTPNYRVLSENTEQLQLSYKFIKGCEFANLYGKKTFPHYLYKLGIILGKKAGVKVSSLMTKTTMINHDLIDWTMKNSDQLDEIVLLAISVILKNKNHFLNEGDNSLVHNDLNFKNIIITPCNKIKIIDWEYASIGSPFIDIGRILRNIYRNDKWTEAFKIGISNGGLSLTENWLQRSLYFDLIACLSTLYRQKKYRLDEKTSQYIIFALKKLTL